MQACKQQWVRNRKGFALVLVFSLASIVLLLGLSLVSLTQVESASSRYDQGLRVARANARLALQMALGDLQELAGPDQRITATADGARSDGAVAVGSSFNNVTDPAINEVYQPFWTGVWDVDNATDTPIWLVTRPLDATYNFFGGIQNADPFISDLGTVNPLVKLVGEGSAKPQNPGAGQGDYDVFVPKEPVGSSDIVGMDSNEQAAIGHYAYWVGDNGVKANYLLEDRVPEVLHDGYASGVVPTDEQLRLEQMAAHRNYLKVDAREMDAMDARLGAIASEFALREGYNEDGTIKSLLGNLTHNDVLRRFHDAAGLSRGLLVDTVRGGLREDLSKIHAVNTGDAVVDVLVNEFLVPYLNIADFAPTSPTELTRSYAIAAKNTTIGGGGPSPAIAPVLVGLKMAIRVRAPDLKASTITSAIKGQLELSVKLWNPYTSHIEGAALNLKLINGLAATGFHAVYSRTGFPDEVSSAVGINDLMDTDLGPVSEFSIEAPPANEWWAPGEIRSFVGVLDAANLIAPPAVALLPSTTAPVDEPAKYYAISALPDYTSRANPSSARGDTSDRIHFQIPSWNPEFSLEIGGEVVATYTLSDVNFQAMNPSDDLPVKIDDNPNIAYVWELDSPLNAGAAWETFDPRYGSLSADVLGASFTSDFQFPGKTATLGHVFQSSATEIFGYNSDASLENNIPIFELPRQELLSMGGLQMAEVPSGLRSHVGASGTLGSINDIFDRFFLSTIPQSTTSTWSVGNPLPNGRMGVVAGTEVVKDLQNKDSAEHLYLNGAFNINSTSVEAWASILKGIRLETWVYDDPLGLTPLTPPEVKEVLDVTGENQFLRFSQTAEETWKGDYSSSDPLVSAREHLRKGLRSLTDPQVELFAEKIVKGVRNRRQSSTGLLGPFVSLQDFIDSGVIDRAIGSDPNFGANLNNGITETYSSQYLTQQDVLTAIAPFLSARSDTFVVRAYGDAVNPFDAMDITARAYCEAIVQRTHEKHETESSADRMIKTDDLPGHYGRKFKVIAFRWLTGDEL